MSCEIKPNKHETSIKITNIKTFQFKYDNNNNLIIEFTKINNDERNNIEYIDTKDLIEITEASKQKYIQPIDPRNVRDVFGVKKYYLNGLLNSWSYTDESGQVIELPAILQEDGTKEYFIDGKRHRDNGLPAIERPNGYKSYYVNGKRHRDNGLPAIERPDGHKEYYVEGKRHRDNGLPAVEHVNGNKEYYLDGQRHRSDGLPAIEYADGHKAYYVNGIKIHPDQIKRYELEFEISKLTRELEKLEPTKVQNQ